LVVGKILSLPFPVANREEVIRLVYLATNPLLTAITAGLLVLICRRLGASRRHALLLAVAFGFGTWAWPHGHTDFTEPGTALALSAATLALLTWRETPTRRWIAATGFLAGWIVITRVSTVLFVPIFLLAGLVLARRRRRPDISSVTWFGLGGLVPALLLTVNSYLRFGSLLSSGYPKVSYSTPAYEGVFGLFLSSGKGLLWYAPICIVAVFGLRTSFLADRGFAVFAGAIVAAHLVVYARFAVWSGENAYGPRYMIPVLPLIIALVAPVVNKAPQWVRGVKIATAIGFLVPGLLGSLLYFNAVYWGQQNQVFANLGIAAPSSPQQYLAWNFQPRSSPLMLEIRSLPDLARNTWARLSGDDGGITPIPGPYNERIYWYARSIEPDVWWAWWSARGDPNAGYLFLIAPVVLIGAGARVARNPKALRQHGPSAVSLI
jgi:hypothetical protein